MRLVITPHALTDLQQAIDYYNEQQTGLGLRFEQAVDTVFGKIVEAPQSASFAYDTVRYKLVNKFPYIIIYEETEKYIVVLRIFNTHKDSLSIS